MIRYENINNHVKIVGNTVKKFEGEKEYVATGDLNNYEMTSSLVTFNDKPSRANLIAKKKSIIFAKMQNTIKVKKIDNELTEYIYSTGFLNIEAKESIDFEYLYWFIRSDFFNNQKDSLSVGATQKAINISSFKKINIAIYPIRKQKDIVQELNNIESLIIIKNNEYIELDNLINSYFMEYFGNPISNEKKWPLKKLVDVVMLKRGYDLPKKSRNNTGNIELYGSNGVVDFHDSFKSSNGIITGRSGTIGNVFYSDKPFWPLNTTLYSTKTYDNNLIYLKFLLKFFDLNRFVAGTGVPTLNRNIVHNEYIIDVPLLLQEKFAAKYEIIKGLKETTLNEIKNLDNLLKSRKQKYFG